MRERIVEAELLDALPADDPRAMRSRRDLRRVNRVMLQAVIMRRLLRRYSTEPPRKILELGGGDGAFMLQVARGLAKGWPGVALTLVDQQDIVGPETHDAFRRLGWSLTTVTADVFDYLREAGPPSADIITANLFLHHFSDAQLAWMFERIAGLTPLLVACEPRRSSVALAGSRLLWAIGCNDVSRHDAAASVRAGFSGMELSALWPTQTSRKLIEHATGPFTHCFVSRATP